MCHSPTLLHVSIKQTLKDSRTVNLGDFKLRKTQQPTLHWQANHRTPTQAAMKGSQEALCALLLGHV